MNNTYNITPEQKGMRLDVFLESTNPEFTRSHYKKQIEEGNVLVNQKQVKAGYALKVGDQVSVSLVPPKELDLTPQNLNLQMEYEDDDLVVINKPQNMVVHPAAGNYSNTLVNGLLYSIKNLSGINGVVRPGIVHRLDKDTSGLLIVAKNDHAHVSLSKQIQTKSCKRYYLALLEGNLKQDSGEVMTNIARDPKNRLKMAVCKEGDGKVAHTLYRVITRYENYCLVEFELKTGRTHQIRVHASYLGHPVVGDELYNPKQNKFGLRGQLLHAYKLHFTQPVTNEPISIQIELPSYFTQVLEKLK